MVEKQTVWKIYKTTCLVNGKVYIGQTKREGSKWVKYLGGGSHIEKAVLRYGKHNFVKQVLIECYSQIDADSYEELYIELYSSTIYKFGYNILSGTANGFGCPNPAQIPEVMQKIKDKISGVNNCNYGKKFSDKTKAKMSESMKGKNLGKKRTDEQILKMSALSAGSNNGFFGKKTFSRNKRQGI